MDAQLTRIGDPAFHCILADSDEVVPGALLVFAHGSLVPTRSELATSAQIGEKERAAFLKPHLAGERAVTGKLRNLEPAIAIEQGRGGTVHFHAFRLYQEVRDFRPVLARRFELFDFHAGGIEVLRRCLEHLRIAATVTVPERAGRQEIGRSEHDLVGLGRCGLHAQCRIVGKSNFAGHPLAVFEIDFEDLANDVVEDRHIRAIRGRAAALFGLPIAGRPHQGFLRAIRVAFPFFQINRDQRIGWEHLIADSPVDVGREGQMTVDYAADARLFGHVQLEPLPIMPDIVQAFVEADPAKRGASMDHALVIAHQAGTGPDIAWLAPEDFLGRCQGGAPLPQARGERIFAFGDGIAAEIAANEQGVFIKPFDAALALFLYDEAAFDELLGGHVEFAQDRCVFAAIRQRDHAETLVGRKAGAALIDPFLAFCRSQRIYIENGFPFDIVTLIAFEGRLAQHALGVLLVLPEVVETVLANGDIGDAVFRIEDGERFCLKLVVPRVLRHVRHGAVILRAHPVERCVTAGFFEPDVRIFVGSRDAVLGVCVSCHAKRHGRAKRECRYEFHVDASLWFYTDSVAAGGEGAQCRSAAWEWRWSNEKGRPEGRPFEYYDGP